MSDRERRLDKIREHADRLHEVARRYDNLRWMAEKDASDAFLALAEAAGALTVDSLSQTATMLEILMSANKEKP